MIPYQNIEIAGEIRNMKFQSSTYTFTGTLDLYEEEEWPTIDFNSPLC